MEAMETVRDSINRAEKIGLISNADVFSEIRILTQQSWIRALDSKFKICSKKLTNFRICYKALSVDHK